MMLYDANKRSAGIAYLLWFFVGFLGGHRFYLKRNGTAATLLILTLLLVIGIGAFGLAFAGLWLLVDVFLIPGMTQEYNDNLIGTLRS